MEDTQERICGRWMPRAQMYCTRRPHGATTKCMTSTAIVKAKRIANDHAIKKTTHRRDVIAAVKQTAGCASCGYDTHAAALDFDHMPGYSKSRNISDMLTFTWANIFDEIMKCEVLCANCHRIRTFERGQNA